ncbi:class I mannose-6-phosphate isomerase [Actinoallomurus rhizosphaericola]|uniref:class I mannose-6-phosphate isomerase n=1 Tax=Actinoallomurus rhizosphaericola TaxID=2952536 RepID=UPI002092C4F3|nr:class I mannose-6-phosphate isomerase [Actinoallomurus rhizosphaericola]MCO5995556.1 class I mannose-6-phosphate isomerase [Actinoallomurus rhizosphaericola]
MRPVVLPPNMPRSFYRGAGRIGRFRDAPTPAAGDPYFPEDWVGSVTARHGAAPAGLTTLPDGRLLATAVAEDPEAWLGPAHLARHGADPAILVKLLDAGERLPVHVHPDRGYATAHLASPYGKTEAWVIVDAAPDAAVHLGFRRDVDAGELRRWVVEQRTGDLLAATNRIPVRPGDAIVCPAGLPHAIGADILLVEVQEPTDFSVLLEWEGYDVDAEAGHLGLGYDAALACVDRSAWDDRRIDALRGAGRAGRGIRPGVDRLFSAAADPFFAAERVHPDPVGVLDPAFSVVVITDGSGVLEAEHGGPLAVRSGQTLLVPYAAGHCTLRGDLRAIRCRPPYDTP